MLESVKISRRQSEIRQALSALVGKEKPSDDETRSMADLDTEYRNNEVRFRAALVAEDTERRDAGKELDTRDGKAWSDLIGRFELRQVALALDEGKTLDGATAEVVAEMRNRGGYRGIPVPWMALERRSGETVASGVPDPKETRPIIVRLFPASVAGRMGAQMINIDHGLVEWPVVTSSVAAGWADGETASVAGPTAFATTDKSLAPNQTLGITMKVTRKSLKQAGDALEQAVRRDMGSAIEAALDKAVFLGTGANGQPSGVLVGSYSITSTNVAADASWAACRGAVARFMTNNAANGPGDVRLLLRPEIWSFMDGTLIEGTAVSEWDRLLKNVPAPVMSSNALAAPAGGPPTTSKALLTTTAGGVPPVFVGLWGGVDLIRDPYSDAASGGLRLTGLVTADVTIARPAQLEILTGLSTVGPEDEGS
jgi:HK97 family phage major capsid protein